MRLGCSRVQSLSWYFALLLCIFHCLAPFCSVLLLPLPFPYGPEPELVALGSSVFGKPSLAFYAYTFRCRVCPPLRQPPCLALLGPSTSFSRSYIFSASTLFLSDLFYLSLQVRPFFFFLPLYHFGRSPLLLSVYRFYTTPATPAVPQVPAHKA